MKWQLQTKKTDQNKGKGKSLNTKYCNKPTGVDIFLRYCLFLCLCLGEGFRATMKIVFQFYSHFRQDIILLKVFGVYFFAEI